MSLFTRISATLSASVDKAVCSIENHDAIIQAALQDTRRSAARSRVRLARVRKDGEKMRDRLERLTQDEVLWTDRAKSVAAQDETQAFECLRRRKQCQAEIKSIRASLTDHEAMEKRLAEGVRQIEKKLGQITQQRNTMRSRESVAEAKRVMSHIDGDVGLNIEDTFERWEISLGETEFDVPEYSDADGLDSYFKSKEETLDLRAELDDLIGSKENV